MGEVRASKIDTGGAVENPFGSMKADLSEERAERGQKVSVLKIKDRCIWREKQFWMIEIIKVFI